MSLLPLQVDADLASGRLCLPLDYCTRHKLDFGQPVIATCSGDDGKHARVCVCCKMFVFMRHVAAPPVRSAPMLVGNNTGTTWKLL